MSAKHAVTIGVACLLFSIVYYQFLLQDSSQLDIEEITAVGLRKLIGEPASYRKIAVGTNANVDLIVSGVALLQELGVTQNPQDIECSAVDSLEGLAQCFSHFMAKGAAAERPITTTELNLLIISSIGKLEPNVQHFVGGNAALIGLKLRDLVPDAQVMLCGPVGPKLKSLLPKDLLVPKKCQTVVDENHLILEYGKNEKWGEVEAPVANRFIMSHDVANSALSTLEPFIEETLAFGPDLVVTSGFHLLNSDNDEFWRKRIADAANAFARLPKSIPVHLELASMTSCPVIIAIVEQIFPLVDSVGLNEQELVFISKCLGGMQANLTELDKSNEIGFYSDLASWVLEEYGEHPLKESRLSRLHFHCLKFHILVVKPARWKSNEASVSAGAWTAFSQACGTDVVNSSKAELKIPNQFRESLSSSKMISFNASDPISVVSRGTIKLYISPVLVCRRPLKTVGLGDAISASGLIYNSFVP